MLYCFGGGIAVCIPIGLGCLLLRMMTCGGLDLEGQVWKGFVYNYPAETIWQWDNDSVQCRAPRMQQLINT